MTIIEKDRKPKRFDDEIGDGGVLPGEEEEKAVEPIYNFPGGRQIDGGMDFGRRRSLNFDKRSSEKRQPPKASNSRKRMFF